MSICINLHTVYKFYTVEWCTTLTKKCRFFRTVQCTLHNAQCTWKPFCMLFMWRQLDFPAPNVQYSICSWTVGSDLLAWGHSSTIQHRFIIVKHFNYVNFQIKNILSFSLSFFYIVLTLKPVVRSGCEETKNFLCIIRTFNNNLTPPSPPDRSIL